MVDDYAVQESAAPFNMAISTLMGIRELFSKIGSIQADPLLSREVKQKLIIELTRSIFEQSSPLLKETVVEKYDSVMLQLFDSNVKRIVRMESGQQKITNDFRSVYSPELEYLSYKLRRDVLRELQKEKYIMPPRKDLSRAVGDM